MTNREEYEKKLEENENHMLYFELYDPQGFKDYLNGKTKTVKRKKKDETTNALNRLYG